MREIGQRVCTCPTACGGHSQVTDARLLFLPHDSPQIYLLVFTIETGSQ